MFILSVLSIALVMAPLPILAGRPLGPNTHLRSRKQRSHVHREITRNLTARTTPAKAGPMTLQDKYAGQNFFE